MSEEAVVEQEVAQEAPVEAPAGGESLISESAPEGVTMEQYRGMFDEQFLEEHGATLDRFQDPKDIFKSYQEARKMASKRGDIPQDWEDTDTVNEFFGKLGKPEGIDGYEIDAPEGVSDDYLGKFKEIALNNNLTKAQAETLFQEMSEYEGEIASQRAEEYDQKRAEDQSVLDKEWGEAKPEMIKAVQNLEQHFGLSPEQMDEVESSAPMLLLLGKVAKALDEKGQVGNVFNSTRQGLEDQISGIEAEMIEVMNENPNSPKLNDLTKKRADLYSKTGKWQN